MTAYNVVRFRVKPGKDQEFIDAHKISDPGFAGMRKFSLINTGPGTYCVVGEWESFDHIIDARPGMIGMLERFRHMLEDLGGGMGVTDPVSGAAIVEMGAAAKPKAKKRKAKKAKAKVKPVKAKAKKKSAKKAAKKPAKKAAKKKKAKRGKR